MSDSKATTTKVGNFFNTAKKSAKNVANSARNVASSAKNKVKDNPKYALWFLLMSVVFIMASGLVVYFMVNLGGRCTALEDELAALTSQVETQIKDIQGKQGSIDTNNKEIKEIKVRTLAVEKKQDSIDTSITNIQGRTLAVENKLQELSTSLFVSTDTNV